MTLPFRSDVEGLRGIAVSAVVLFHAFPKSVPGGFAGVDVFFVISSFVITRLLMAELAHSNQINLFKFWARRVRRILPLATLVAISIGIAAICVKTLDTRELGRQLIATTLFYFNYREAGRASDYLNTDHSQNPILHFWSLSVEEQFYLFWPLLIAAAAWSAPRDRAALRQRLTGATGILWLLSLAYGCYLTLTAPSFAFYDTVGRAYQLLTGAVLAQVESSVAGAQPRLKATAAALALIGLCIAFFVPLGHFHYPGLAALIPIACTAAILRFSSLPRDPVARLLGMAPLRYLGRISFGLYLWHWPLLVFAGQIFGRSGFHPGWVLALGCLLACLTYHTFENPIRNNAALKISLARTAYAGVFMVALGLTLGFALKYLGPDLVPVAPGRYRSAEAIKYDRPSIYANGCLVRFEGTVSPPCRFGDTNSSNTVVLLGDSHAGNWAAPLEQAAAEQGWQLIVRTKASCRPIDTPQMRIDGPERPYPECNLWLQSALLDIDRLKPQLIIVGGTNHDLPIEAELRVIRRLAMVAPTIVMRDTVWLPEASAACLRRTQSPTACTWPLDRFTAKNSYPRSSPIEHGANVEILDLNSRVCPGGTCSAVQNGTVVMYDNSHFTNSFAVTLSDAFRGPLKKYARAR